MCAHKLFPIPLQGQGTPDVESLSSYLFRSAHIHGTSVGTFLTVIHELDALKELPYQRLLSAKKGVSMLSQENVYTAALRNKLSEFTGQNMLCDPLSFLNRLVFGLTQYICGFRWCPECFCDLNRAGLPPYIKQIWHMVPVTHCPIHRTPLVNRCESCGVLQNVFSADVSIGSCFTCFNKLFPREQKLSPNDLIPSWHLSAQGIIEVFERVTYSNMIDTSKKKIRDFIEKRYQIALLERQRNISDEIKSDIALFEHYRGNSTGNYRLQSLQTIAMLMKISLFDLLIAGEGCHQVPLDFKRSQKLPEYLKPKQRLRRDHKKELERLLKILEAQSKPISLKALARQADLSVGYIEYRFPDLVRKVVDDRESYLKSQSLTSRYHAQAAALKFFMDEKYSSYPKSRKEAYRVLSAETGLPKWVLKHAIQTAYSVLKE
ncbi:TniQ family protein [Saccharophagus degradans]|uniref:TniQ family protein n=1 Tax=Saccharophagus degradans TaxID=86304 RepID=A0AAW7X974_9GAMM|nr:TniQ family protein [Saccharophagus degradans]MDO6423058.1 TniQ family protein [Saccharophagus degradans]MDO6607418.1 TniQ family protein [Saccharophagus degradans]